MVLTPNINRNRVYYSRSEGDKMDKYYVNDNAQPTGEHEVHKAGCSWLAKITSKTYLGEFASCSGAVTKAKSYYINVDGCAHCCPSCHTK